MPTPHPLHSPHSPPSLPSLYALPSLHAPPTSPACGALDAVGASVTTATLMDDIVASEGATFSLPFAKLGVPPEGCSSVTFKEMLGEANAERMLGLENWSPTATEVHCATVARARVAREHTHTHTLRHPNACVCCASTHARVDGRVCAHSLLLPLHKAICGGADPTTSGPSRRRPLLA